MSLIVGPTNTNLRTALLMGETGSGKTTQLALAAKYLWNTKKIRTRLIAAENGGTVQFDDEGLIEQGIVQRFDLGTVEKKFLYLARISKGYWPDSDGVIKAEDSYREGSENYGCMMLDGLSGISEMLGEHASTPDSNVAFKLGSVSSESEEGDTYKFGTMAEAHYQIVHKEIRKAIFGFNAQKHLQYFFATARIKSGQDRTKTKCYVPSTIGKALDTEIPASFQDLLHFDSAMVSGEQVSRHLNIKLPEEQLQQIGEMKVCWFKEHRDEGTNIKYPCKARIGPSLVEHVNSGRFREGFLVLDTKIGFIRFYEYLRNLKQKIAESEQIQK